MDSIDRVCSLPGCERVHVARGLCNAHWKQQRKSGDLSVLLPLTDIERFWSYVQKTPTCWLWVGPLSGKGRGAIRASHRTISVRRFSWESHKGSIPRGLVVLHNCTERLCVNPEHLWLGTNREKARDAKRKGITSFPKAPKEPKRRKSTRHVKLRTPSNTPDAEHFWALVEKTEGCWLWAGPLNAGGYGRCWLHKERCAHRASFLLTHGSIALGKQILHNCPGGDNRRCVNPAHLYEGTSTDNNRDTVRKGRYPGCKFSDDQIRALRATYNYGEYSMPRLARDYGVSSSTICQIINRDTYRHVD